MFLLHLYHGIGTAAQGQGSEQAHQRLSVPSQADMTRARRSVLPVWLAVALIVWEVRWVASGALSGGGQRGPPLSASKTPGWKDWIDRGKSQPPPGPQQGGPVIKKPSLTPQLTLPIQQEKRPVSAADWKGWIQPTPRTQEQHLELRATAPICELLRLSRQHQL